MHVDSDISPTEFSDTYSQISLPMAYSFELSFWNSAQYQWASCKRQGHLIKCEGDPHTTVKDEADITSSKKTSKIK